MSTPVAEFPIAQLEKNSLVAIIGPSFCGKTTVVNHLLDLAGEKLQKGIVFAHVAQEYTNSKLTVHNKFNENTIKEYFKGSDYTNLSAIVFDDILPDPTYLENLIKRRRHYNQMVLLTSQVFKSRITNIIVRANTDYVFIARMNDISSRKTAYDHYCSVCLSFTDFTKIMDSLLNHEFIVIDQLACKLYKYMGSASPHNP